MKDSMFSLSEGDPVAVFLGSERQIIYITDERDKSDIEITQESDTSIRELRALQKKVKFELDFIDGENGCVIPLIQPGFNRSILLVGPSGSGKTFLAAKIISASMQKIEIISPIRNDSSLSEIKDRIDQIDIKNYMAYPLVEELADKIIFFDDVETMPKKDIAVISAFRDNLLQTGRHSRITVITATHLLNDYARSKIPLNECEYIVLFPKFDRRPAEDFMRFKLKINKTERDKLIDLSVVTGRYMCIKVSHPRLMIHTGGIVLIGRHNNDVPMTTLMTSDAVTTIKC